MFIMQEKKQLRLVVKKNEYEKLAVIQLNLS